MDDFQKIVLNAWVSSKQQRDRTLLGLAVGGIGVMVTLVTVFGLPNGWLAALYLVPTVSFLAAMAIALRVSAYDADHLQEVFKDAERAGLSKTRGRMKTLDWWLPVCFWTGVVSALLLTFLIAVGDGLSEEPPLPEDLPEAVGLVSCPPDSQVFLSHRRLTCTPRTL